MTLNPTRTRMRRLASVAAGAMHWYLDRHSYDDFDGYRVDAAMADLERAGWVTLAEPSPLYVHKRPWLLTALGTEVLEKSRKGSTK